VNDNNLSSLLHSTVEVMMQMQLVNRYVVWCVVQEFMCIKYTHLKYTLPSMLY